MAVITVSRQYGSNGAAIARLIAERLGYRLLGREMVDAIAERAGVTPEAAQFLDERGFGWGGGLIHSLLMGFQGQAIDQETYRLIACRLIREAAAQDNLVVLGRGGQIVLAGRPNTFHVHVVAPFADRVAEISRRERTGVQAAERRVRETDDQRSRYVRAIGSRDWSDATLYHLVVNVRRMTPGEAADLIFRAAQGVGVLKGPLAAVSGRQGT